MRLVQFLLGMVVTFSYFGVINAPAAHGAAPENAALENSPVVSGTAVITAAPPLSITASIITSGTEDHAPAPPIHPDVLVAPAASQATRGPNAGNPAPMAPSIPITGLASISNPAQPSPYWRNTENFLILGTDRRSSKDIWRTDVVMILGLDRANQKAALLSVPRDLYVEVPGYDWKRINQVDYVGERILRVDGGGPALVSTVLSQTLGVSTDHWVRVDMQGLISLVDTIGGVTVHLDCPFYEPIYNLDTNQWEYFTLPAGEVLMDGETAHWFTRLRLRESDIGRSARQRQFLWALREQVLQTEQLVRLPQIWSDLSDMFTTDLTLVEMVDLVRLGLTLNAENVHAAGITLKELQSVRTEQGASVLRIVDPYRVRAVVDGVWQASPMATAYAQNADACPPVPTGTPVIPEQIDPEPDGKAPPEAEAAPDSATPEDSTADGNRERNESP